MFRHVTQRWRRGLLPSVLAWLLGVRQWLDAIRIRAHLRRTEVALRRSEPGDLTPAQRKRRAQALDNLHEYWHRGVFPTNEASDTRTPQFVGGNGVPCAVAALLLADDQDDLVESIASTTNDVRIEDLNDGPILEWLDANGFTQAEAARIQPAYILFPPTGVEFATTCGPVACSTAKLLVSTVALAAFACAEVVGYRLVGDVFPDNPFKRRSTLAYVTVLNLLLTPVVALLLYALFP